MKSNNANSILTIAIGGVFVSLFFAVIFYIIFKGFHFLSFDFIFSDPEDAGRAGGIRSVIVSTLVIILVMSVLLIPIGSVIALEMHALDRSNKFLPFNKLINRSMNILAGTPSIVFGLLGNYFFCNVMGFGYSILSGALTLFCMCLPFYVKVFYEQIQQIPHKQWISSLSMGISGIRYLVEIVLPQSKNAILLAFLLSAGRGFSETAALLFTSGYSTRMPNQLLDSGRTISIHIYDLSMNVPGGNGNAYASVIVLLIIVLSFNVMLKVIFKKGFKNEGLV